jgi:hypothetical protein
MCAGRGGRTGDEQVLILSGSALWCHRTEGSKRLAQVGQSVLGTFFWNFLRSKIFEKIVDGSGRWHGLASLASRDGPDGTIHPRGAPAPGNIEGTFFPPTIDFSEPTARLA